MGYLLLVCQRQDVKYVNHLSPKHDYGMFNNSIKPYAADQYGLRIFKLTKQYYAPLYIQIWYKKMKFMEKFTTD